MKHTKGKWRFAEKLNFNGFFTGFSIDTGDPKYKTIADVSPVDRSKTNGDEDLESLANAKLIASAPELLEALKYANNLLERGWSESANNEILKAIKKAEG